MASVTSLYSIQWGGLNQQFGDANWYWNGSAWQITSSQFTIPEEADAVVMLYGQKFIREPTVWFQSGSSQIYLTRRGGGTDGNIGAMQFYDIIKPPSGTYDLRLYQGNATFGTVYLYTVTGIDYTDPYGENNSSSTYEASGTSSIELNTEPNNIVIDILQTAGSNTTSTTGPSQNILFQNSLISGSDSTLKLHGSYLNVTQSSATMSWTTSAAGSMNTFAQVYKHMPFSKTIAKPSTEIITNGGFDADTNWVKDTNWTISDGVATFSGSNYAELRQGGFSLQNPMPAGKMYKVTFTISNHVVGGVRVLLGFTAPGAGTTRSANGTYTEFIRSGTVSNDFRFIHSVGDGDFSIDNVSVKEIPFIQSDTQWFYDDFNRPNQSITASSDWDENTLYTNDNGVNWFIEDGTIGPAGTSGLTGFAFLNTASYQWTNDQLAEVVYADIGTFDYGGPVVRLNFGPGHESGSGYVLRHDGLFDDSRRIYRIDNGTLDTTYRNVTYTIVAGDKVRLEAVGNTINCYVNGVLEDSLTDSTYESGSVGVFYKKENTATTRLDSFYAQNIVSGQTGKPFKIS